MGKKVFYRLLLDSMKLDETVSNRSDSISSPRQSQFKPEGRRFVQVVWLLLKQPHQMRVSKVEYLLSCSRSRLFPKVLGTEMSQSRYVAANCG